MVGSFLIDGEVKSTVSCLDRGLQFGDGLFETLAVINGEIQHWPLHWRRFSQGCERLYLPLPKEAQLKEDICSLIKNQPKQVVKFIYTRGVTERGYGFSHVEPTRIVTQFSWPNFNSKNACEGVELFLCTTKLSHQPLLAGMKHLNRLENVLARHEWTGNKFAEGLLLDINELVIEGTMSNIFIVKNQRLKTPALSQCGVAGITRQRIIFEAKNINMAINIGDLCKDELFQADEIFICNSLIGIWPVKKISQQCFSTDSKNNLVTRLLQQKINANYECVI